VAPPKGVPRPIKTIRPKPKYGSIAGIAPNEKIKRASVATYVPTEEDKNLVCAMRGAGITDQQISWVLNIAVDTLIKYFGHITEAEAKEAVKGRLIGNLFRLSMKDDFKAFPGIFFYLKTQYGYRERERPSDDVPVDENGMPVVKSGQEVHIVVRHSPDAMMPGDMSAHVVKSDRAPSTPTKQ